MSEKDYIISLLDKYLKYLEENENKYMTSLLV